MFFAGHAINMLTIRLSRVGKKNKPTYRLVISEKARDLYGRVLEFLGSYDPHAKKLEVKAERIKYWLKHGSGMSATVNNLLIRNNIIEGKIVKATRMKKKEAGKAEENPNKQEKAEKPADSALPTENKKEEVKKSSADEKPEVSQKIAENKVENQASASSGKTENKI